MKVTKIKRALLSVSDKEGIVELGRFLKDQGVELISSGGTAKVLMESGLEVTPIEQVTGNPEAFGGRMKTLSFQVSSALLYRRGHEGDEAQAKELGIEPIDLVVCNLYPFSEVVKKRGEWHELIENIDIGGPTMVRAAAKNHDHVVVLTQPRQYAGFVEQFQLHSGALELSTRSHYALEAFRHTAEYDALISQTLEKELLGKSMSFHGDLQGKEAKKVRYGENPHQKGFVVPVPSLKERQSLAQATPLQGKELSYNNYLDTDAAWRCNSDLQKLDPKKHAVTIVKHSNPCGAALGLDNLSALEKAWSGDPISAFGSIIAFGHAVDEAEASFICERFVEVVIAPSFSDAAREKFSKKKNLRLIELDWEKENFEDLMVRTIDGGFVVQEEDNGREEDIQVVSGDHPAIKDELLRSFGIRVTKHLKSNAIGLVAREGETFFLVGAGMGNPNRLVSLEQACAKARENGLTNFSDYLLISDAFFPFRDNIDLAASMGLKAIVQPGGSIKDKEVIAACQELNVSMATTGMRHFRH